MLSNDEKFNSFQGDSLEVQEVLLKVFSVIQAAAAAAGNVTFYDIFGSIGIGLR